MPKINLEVITKDSFQKHCKHYNAHKYKTLFNKNRVSIVYFFNENFIYKILLKSSD